MVLEPLQESHAAELWASAAEPELWRYMLADVRNAEDLRAWIRARLEPVRAGTAHAFLQRDARTGVAFGSTSLFDIDRTQRRMEVGHTWLGASHRRTAANTEAKLLLLGHAFGAERAVRVQLKCDERNVRSAQAIARLGAVREGVWRHQMILPDGHRRNAVVFSILETEWPVVRAGLEARLAARP